MQSHQFSLSLIQHQVSNSVVEQRGDNGYINATALCKAAGKRWHNYVRQETTGHFLRALEAKTRISALVLIQEVRVAGVTAMWVHPKVAIHLAQWLSADFAVQVSEWVYDWASAGKSSPTAPQLPYHIRRHMLNHGSVPAGYFSILQEMTFIMIAPLDSMGYQMPGHMLPDISMGKFLCKHLRDKLGIDTDELPVYMHRFEDGRTVQAKLYPESVLAEFRRLIREEWMPRKAADYFKERDPVALAFLDKLPALASPVAPVPKKLSWRKKQAA